MPTSVTEAIHAVEAADSSAKLVAAVRSLAQCCDVAAIPTLMTALGFNNPGAAIAAVDGLVAIGPAAVEPIMQHIDGYNYSARAWAVRALAQIADPRSLDILLAAAETDFAPSVRRAAAKGLGAIRWANVAAADRRSGQERSLTVLETVAEDLEWVARYAAIAGLAGLAQATADEAPPICHAALAKIKTRAIDDPDRVVRLRAQWALQTLAPLQVA